jgi:hypothetical protein
MSTVRQQAEQNGLQQGVRLLYGRKYLRLKIINFNWHSHSFSLQECTGSICLAYDLESCQCIPGPNEPKTKACDLCCKKPGEKSECKSSFEWNKPPFDVPDMYAKPGTPCNNYNGYCDVFQKCRDVDPSGPLATLRKLLLSEESIASFKKWATSNWYILVITCLLILALLVSVGNGICGILCFSKQFIWLFCEVEEMSGQEATG